MKYIGVLAVSALIAAIWIRKKRSAHGLQISDNPCFDHESPLDQDVAASGVAQDDFDDICSDHPKRKRCRRSFSDEGVHVSL